MLSEDNPMKAPEFVKLALRLFLVEMVLVVVLPLFGYGALMGLMFLVPMKMAAGVEGALDWLKETDSEDCRWNALAKCSCAIALLFLLLCVAFVSWPPPGQEDIWGVLAYLFLLLQLFRFYGAALFTALFSLVTFVFSSSRLGKLSSVSAFLSSLGGLYFFREILNGRTLANMSQSFEMVGVQSGGADSTFVLIFLTLGYLYAIVWGAVLQWAARQWHEG